MITLDDITNKIIPALIGGGGLKLIDHLLMRRARLQAKASMNRKQLLSATKDAARIEFSRRINALEKLVLASNRRERFWERKYHLMHDQLIEMKSDYRNLSNRFSALVATKGSVSLR